MVMIASILCIQAFIVNNVGIGWIGKRNDRLTLQGFERHISSVAKQRMMNTLDYSVPILVLKLLVVVVGNRGPNANDHILKMIRPCAPESDRLASFCLGSS